jgi:hypothetical protein
MKAYALLIAAGLLAACQRDLPTASDPATPTVRLTAEQARMARIAISDALGRIVPELSGTEATPLASSLASLLTGLGEGAIDGAALAGAMHHVMQYEQATDTHAAELEVIRLALGTLQK